MRNLATILTLFFLALLSVETMAQKKKSPPASASGEVDGVSVKIDYHQPSARGREIMGGLVPFDEVWRTGANNATTIEFGDDVLIEGDELAKGKYALFTIPGEDEWTIIFNSQTDIWGTEYNEAYDVLRVTVDAGSTDEFVETFDISVEDNYVVLSWEDTMVMFEISK